MKRWVPLAATFAAALATVGALSLAEAGCYDPHICSSDQAPEFGDNPGEGEQVSPDLWESSPQSGKWLPFPKGRSQVFFPRGLEGRDFVRVDVYVSTDQQPSITQFTTGAGSLGEVHIGNDRVTVINGTCENYFVRVVVEAYPLPPDAGPIPEAGAPAPPVTDASLDAPDGD